MKFDTKQARELLNECGGSGPTMSMAVNSAKLDGLLIKELIEAPYQDWYNPPSDEIDEAVRDFPHNVEWDMEDVTFCIVDEHGLGGEPVLYVSLRADPSWDQDMLMPELDDNPEWQTCMEQAWEYKGDKDIPTLIAELEAMGGVYDKNLEQYFV